MRWLQRVAAFGALWCEGEEECCKREATMPGVQEERQATTPFRGMCDGHVGDVTAVDTTSPLPFVFFFRVHII